MAMYSWLIYSCFIFGSSILCDRKLEKGQAVISVSEDNDDMFYCSNGLEIKWSLVCDGHKDCSDGLDETKELCARYEYGTNISMDCGTVSNESKKGHLLEATPWIVDIYAIHNKSNIPKQLGLGSIISPNLVVTAAYVLWEYGIRYTQYSIGIPLQTDNENNHYFIDVKNIYQNDEPSYTNVSSEDLAVIVLANKISFSNGVTPVCIDWYSKYKVQNGAYGKIAGFKRNTQPDHTVLQRFFPHIKNISCTTPYNIVKSYDYCIELQLEERVDDEFFYQSLSFLHSNSYFLTGIVSYWHNWDNHKDLSFRDIKYYVPWIRGILNKHSTESSCVLPTVEGVVHSFEDSHLILSPGTLINSNTIVIENCKVGYHKAHPNGFRVCERYGIWKMNSDNLCIKMCPPLLSDSLDITCSYNSTYADCSNLSIPGTIAAPKCKPSYTLPNGQKETPIELHCQSNGTWNNELTTCEPDCGRQFKEPKILISSGDTAHFGTAPWNVAIYKKISDYELICGGSIISRNLVVSAAHCFWKKGMSYNITIFDGLYKIVAGIYYRNFRIYGNQFAQIMDVDRIHLKDGYFGGPGYYAEDIAVVVLQKSIHFGDGIIPICMDWEEIYNVSNGDRGEVFGWGKTKKGIESPILLKNILPYINMTTCRDMFKNGFESYVTHDKFCAGSPLVSGTGVDEVDSGAGLCFSHSKLYYLTGVASLKDNEANNSIALFTSVRHHIQWIHGLYLYNLYN